MTRPDTPYVRTHNPLVAGSNPAPSTFEIGVSRVSGPRFDANRDANPERLLALRAWRGLSLGARTLYLLLDRGVAAYAADRSRFYADGQWLSEACFGDDEDVDDRTAEGWLHELVTAGLVMIDGRDGLVFRV